MTKNQKSEVKQTKATKQPKKTKQATAENKKVTVKLVKSLIGRKQQHIDTANALGLRKLNSQKEHNYTAPIAGMINVIDYLVEVKEV